MNCKNCGAPLERVDEHDHFRCEFCSTLHFPEKMESSADGITPLEEPTDFFCPACETHHLWGGTLDGVNIFYCERCRGILIDSESFGQLVRDRRAGWDGPEDHVKPLNPELLKRKIACPVCGRPMDTHPYFGPGNVVIDSCLHCAAIWCDHGEIAAIERAPGRR